MVLLKTHSVLWDDLLAKDAEVNERNKLKDFCFNWL